MRVKIISQLGQAPIVLDASVVIVEDDVGNPVMIGSDYGPPNTFVVAHIKDAGFNRICKALGIDRTAFVDTIEMPKPPAEARLIRGPNE